MLLQLIPLIVLIIVILIYGLIGYIQGARKISYYIASDILVTIILLTILSFVSFSSFYNTENLIEILRFIFRIPNELQEYFLNEEVSQFINLIADIVIRLVLFVGIFAITKFLLKITLFRKLYPIIVNGVKRKKSKRNRAYGFLIGSVKGLIVSFIFVLPAVLYELPKYEEIINNIINLLIR